MDILYKQCGRCNGAGSLTNRPSGAADEIPCVTCAGVGYLDSGQTVDLSTADDGAQTDIAALDVKADDILDKCNDILNKCNDILEWVSE